MKIKGTPCWGRTQYSSEPKMLAHMMSSANLILSCQSEPVFQAMEYLPTLDTWPNGFRKIAAGDDGVPIQINKRYRVVSFEIEIEEITDEG